MSPSAHLHRAWLRLVLALLALGASPWAWCEDLPEYRLKAAFIYNFATFTEWPAEVGNTLHLCIYGADPFGAEIEPINGKKVGERSIAVQRKTTLESLRDCQIVFVAGSAIGQLPRVLETLRGLPVLTVADSPDAARKGAALNMNVAQGRVTFNANLEAARAARLNLSSKLLRLATEVFQ